MSGTDAPARLARVLDAIADAVGVSTAELLGAAVALDLRWQRRPDGMFLAAYPQALIELFETTFGGVVDLASAAASDLLVAELWTEGPHAIGTGPVATDLAPAITWRATEPRSDDDLLDKARRLRQTFAAAAERLAPAFSDELDLDGLLDAAQHHGDVVHDIVLDLAASRGLVGRWLLDAADELDDERIDQLGDGYVKASAAWSALATQQATTQLDRSALWDVVELERTCWRWMTGASQPPTRYAF